MSSCNEKSPVVLACSAREWEGKVLVVARPHLELLMYSALCYITVTFWLWHLQVWAFVPYASCCTADRAFLSCLCARRSKLLSRSDFICLAWRHWSAARNGEGALRWHSAMCLLQRDLQFPYSRSFFPWTQHWKVLVQELALYSFLRIISRVLCS